MKAISYIFVFLGATSLFSQQTLEEVLAKYNDDSIPYISSETLANLEDNTATIVLDTREKKEYEVSHIRGAIHVGYKTFDINTVSENIKNKDTPIVVYCSLGIRSEDIGETLEKAGYTKVKNLYGGIFRWKNKDFSVVNTQQKETDSVHVYSKKWGKWLYKGIKVSNK
jgi:rhodanese-related sulfurtransferase